MFLTVTTRSALAHVQPIDREEARAVLAADSWANGCDVSPGERAALEAFLAGHDFCRVPAVEAQASGLQLAADGIAAGELKEITTCLSKSSGRRPG